MQNLFDLHKVAKALSHFSYLWSLPSAPKTHFGLVGPFGVKIVSRSLSFVFKAQNSLQLNEIGHQFK